jgi:hypothetical protein
MGTIKLQWEEEDDFFLWGIRSSERDYRVAYLLNAQMDLGFEKSRSNVQTRTKKGSYEFSLFEYRPESGFSEWYLLSNAGQGKENTQENIGLFGGDEIVEQTHFLPTHKSFDYFIIVYGIITDEEIAKLQEVCNRITYFAKSEEIDPDSIPNKADLQNINHGN